MNFKWPAVLIAALFSTSATAAEFREYSDLPPQSVVQQALQDYPSVQAAQSGIKAGEAARDRLEAGTHEFNVVAGTGAQQASILANAFTNGTSVWNVRCVCRARPSSMPHLASKAWCCRRMPMAMPCTKRGAACFPSGLPCCANAAQSEQWQQQVGVLKQQLDVVSRRVKAGDASRLEEDMAQAALMQAEISLRQASLRADNASVELSRYFPSLALPHKTTSWRKASAFDPGCRLLAGSGAGP